MFGDFIHHRLEPTPTAGRRILTFAIPLVGANLRSAGAQGEWNSRCACTALVDHNVFQIRSALPVDVNYLDFYTSGATTLRFAQM